MVGAIIFGFHCWIRSDSDTPRGAGCPMYPEQVLPVLTHRRQHGFASSHLTRRILHVEHPLLTLRWKRFFRCTDVNGGLSMLVADILEEDSGGGIIGD